MTEETGEEDKLLGRIIDEAVKTVFDQHFDPEAVPQHRRVFRVGQHDRSRRPRAGSPDPQADRGASANSANKSNAGAAELDAKLAATPLRPQLEASVAEFILDGLYTHNRLNKKQKSGAATYGQ